MQATKALPCFETLSPPRQAGEMPVILNKAINKTGLPAEQSLKLVYLGLM